MINLPKKKYKKRTNCNVDHPFLLSLIDCDCVLTKNNCYVNQGKRDIRCLVCRRKNMKKINDKRYARIKKHKFF